MASTVMPPLHKGINLLTTRYGDIYVSIIVEEDGSIEMNDLKFFLYQRSFFSLLPGDLLRKMREAVLGPPGHSINDAWMYLNAVYYHTDKRDDRLDH